MAGSVVSNYKTIRGTMKNVQGTMNGSRESSPNEEIGEDETLVPPPSYEEAVTGGDRDMFRYMQSQSKRMREAATIQSVDISLVNNASAQDIEDFVKAGRNDAPTIFGRSNPAAARIGQNSKRFPDRWLENNMMRCSMSRSQSQPGMQRDVSSNPFHELNPFTSSGQTVNPFDTDEEPEESYFAANNPFREIAASERNKNPFLHDEDDNEEKRNPFGSD